MNLDVDLFALFDAAAPTDADRAEEARVEAARRNPPAKCPRCCGHGIITAYYYVSGGVCFDCGGNGIDHGPSGERPHHDD